LDVTRETLHEWARVHPEFSDAFKIARQIQEQRWIAGSLSGEFNPAFTIFFGKNVFRWQDRHEHQIDASENIMSAVVNALGARLNKKSGG